MTTKKIQNHLYFKLIACENSCKISLDDSQIYFLMIWFNVSTKILRHNPIKKKKTSPQRYIISKKKKKKKRIELA